MGSELLLGDRKCSGIGLQAHTQLSGRHKLWYIHTTEHSTVMGNTYCTEESGPFILSQTQKSNAAGLHLFRAQTQAKALCLVDMRTGVDSEQGNAGPTAGGRCWGFHILIRVMGIRTVYFVAMQ